MARARSRFDREPEVQPKNDAYTGLLVISLIALILSCLFLALDFTQYGETKAPKDAPVTAPKAGTAAINQADPIIARGG